MTTKKKQTTNTDFEELTSLTALIEEPTKKEDGKSKKEEESQNPTPNQNPKIQKAQTQTKPKKKTNSKLKPKKSYATPKEAGETPSKVMTSIIISEDVRDWLRIQSITTKQSMSQQIEELVKKEMKKAK